MNYIKKNFSDIYNKSTYEVLEKIGITKDPKLFALLCANFGDIGLAPKKMPFFMNTLLFLYYVKSGSAYPKKGCEELTQQIANEIVAYGG